MPSSFHFDDTGLRRLGDLFAQGHRVVRVGILSGPKLARKHKTGAQASDETNADIGAKQEFGSFGISPDGAGGWKKSVTPPRSFLYKPLRSAKARKRIVSDATEGLQRELERGQAVDAQQSFYGKIGAGLVATVHDAFDVSGPGWKALAPATIEARRTRKVWPRMGTKPLIDLGELREAVSFRVVGK